MDEILASIRRIIESGDERDGADGRPVLSIPSEIDGLADPNAGAEPVAAFLPASPVPSFDVHYLPAPLGEEATGREAPEIRASLEDRSVVEFHEPDAPDLEGDASPAVAAKAPVMAAADAVDDVSDDAWWDAAVAGAGERGSVDARSAGDEPPQPGAGAVLPPPDNENGAAFVGPEAVRSNWNAPSHLSDRGSDDHGGGADSQTEAPSAAFPPIAAMAKSEPPAAFARPPQPVPAEIPESVIAGASALLSAQAGDQVAAAFDDLTRAIREGQMRSMEGMAREIMRPMLQEWLDDNLPRIVERLVREEIERIARGPRR